MKVIQRRMVKAAIVLVPPTDIDEDILVDVAYIPWGTFFSLVNVPPPKNREEAKQASDAAAESLGTAVYTRDMVAIHDRWRTYYESISSAPQSVVEDATALWHTYTQLKHAANRHPGIWAPRLWRPYIVFEDIMHYHDPLEDSTITPLGVILGRTH